MSRWDGRQRANCAGRSTDCGVSSRSRCSTAARGIDLRAPLRPAPATAAVIAAVRSRVPGPGTDRYLAPEIEAVIDLVRGGDLLRAAEAVVGKLA